MKEKKTYKCYDNIRYCWAHIMESVFITYTYFQLEMSLYI